MTRTAHPRSSLSAAQRGIWLGQCLDPDSAQYNAAEYLDLRGALDGVTFETALRLTFGEAQVLSARCTVREGQPGWEWSPESELSWSWVDLSGAPAPEQAALAWMRADLKRPFALEQGPLSRHALLRVSADHHLWYHCAHHVALDGFGFALIARRVAEVYTAMSRARAIPPARFGTLASVSDEDRRYRASVAWASDRDFWLDYLRDAPEPPTLGRPPERLTRGRTLQQQTVLEESIKRKLESSARAQRASWVEAFVALFAAYLARRSGETQVVLGLPVMGRMGSVSLRVPAMVMNIVPLRVRVDRDATLGGLTSRVHAELARIKPHMRYRYEDLRRDLAGVGQHSRAFGPVVNVMPFDHGFRFAGRYAPAENLSAGPVEDLAVALTVHADGSPPRLRFDASEACYEDSEVQAHLSAFVAFAARALVEPDAALAEFDAARVEPRESRASEKDASRVLEGSALREACDDVSACIARRVGARPAAVAVEHGDERLSYAELHDRALRVAASLAERALGGGGIVGVLLPRGVDAVAAIVGTLAAGGAYLPLDANGPEGRTEAILADARPEWVITTADLANLVRRSGLRVLLWDEALRAEPLASPVEATPEQAAYVIYTSGSTGVPNGVVVSRGALAHFRAAAQQAYAVASEDRVLQFAPLHFDASVEELFLTLGCGATLVVRSDDMLDSVPHFCARCAGWGISVLDLPTAFWHELVFSLDQGDCALPETLRMMIIGGEAASPERVQQWRARVSPALKLWNTYGPTEATVVAVVAPLHALAVDLQDQGRVPIGRPLPGTSAVVIASDGRPATGGQQGELHLMGPALASGYLNREALQASRFIRLAGVPGAPRAYRTGDVVRLGGDGQLCFVGRVDEELKLSGHRVHPGEVEGVLLRHPDVREAAVVICEAGSFGKQLVAHVGSPLRLSEGELRRHTARELVGPAVPARFVCRERLPRTSTGKIDRKGLRRMPLPGVCDEPEGALTELQAQVVRVWSEVLGRAGLGLEDNFFERGGHSLQAIQVASRLSALLGRPVPAALLFRHPTVAQLACALDLSEPAVRVSAGAQLPGVDLTLPPDIQPRGSGGEGEPTEVVLTGATGFVGVHLLAGLLSHTAARVICLVRAGDETLALARVRDALVTHGLETQHLESRVRALPAELARTDLALSRGVLADLEESCQAVVHCAASVSLVRDYASVRDSNVVATRELLRFACRGTPKSFHQISTLAAAVTTDTGQQLPERFVGGRPTLGDGYSQSKWVAEHLVEQAVSRGLDGYVYRLGRVVGPASSGHVNPQDILWRLLRLGIPRGVVPDLQVSEPWTPVDFVARAVASFVSDRPRSHRVFNLAPAPPVLIAQVLSWVQDYGFAVKRAPLSTWRSRLGDDLDAAAWATLAFLELQEDSGEKPAFGAHTCAGKLTGELAARGIECPVIDRALVHRNLDFCVRTGLLPPPHDAAPSSHPYPRRTRP